MPTFLQRAWDWAKKSIVQGLRRMYELCREAVETAFSFGGETVQYLGGEAPGTARRAVAALPTAIFTVVVMCYTADVALVKAACELGAWLLKPLMLLFDPKPEAVAVAV